MSLAKSYPHQSDPTSPKGGVPAEPASANRFRFLTRSTSLYILLVELGLLALFSLVSPNFFSRSNFTNIAWDTSETLLLAIGQTFVIITAGIDLSVGTILMLSGVAASWIMAEMAGTPAEIANGQHPHALLAILVGVSGGIIVGPFSMARGLGHSRSSAGAGGQPPIPPVPDMFASSVGNGNLVFGLPTLVIFSGIAAVLAHIILKHTIFGRRTFAVGSSFESSRLAGVPVVRQLI